MLDTVHYRCRRPLTDDIVSKLEKGGGAYRGDGWYIRIAPSLDRFDKPVKTLYCQGPFGIIARGHYTMIELVQVPSLPGLLFGTNGKLIRTPQDLTAAFVSVNAMLDEISIPARPLIEYIRADLVLHFRCNVQQYIAAHRHARHPFVRNETHDYDGSGLSLRGQKVIINFYDKALQMGNPPGDVLRLEIQLHKPKLGEVFGEEEGHGLSHIDFWAAYTNYRRLVFMFGAKPVAVKVNFNLLIAECEAVGFHMSNGLTVMENYKATNDHKTFLDRRRQIKGLIPTVANINWEELLPLHSLPEDLPEIDQ